VKTTESQILQLHNSYEQLQFSHARLQPFSIIWLDLHLTSTTHCSKTDI